MAEFKEGRRGFGFYCENGMKGSNNSIIRPPKAVVFFLARIERAHNVLLTRGKLGHKITYFYKPDSFPLSFCLVQRTT